MSFSVVKSLIKRDSINELFKKGSAKRYEIDILKLQNIHPLINEIFQSLSKVFQSIENKKSPSRIDGFLNIIESLYKENNKEKLSVQISKDAAKKIENFLFQYKISLKIKDFIKIFITEINSKSIVVRWGE